MRLFDTTFVVDLVNSDPGARHLATKVEEDASLAAISAVTVHEYIYGIRLRYGGQRRELLEEKLAAARNDLDVFEVIPFTKEIAEVSSSVQAELARTGKQIDINDVYIAATGLAYGMKVVTRNKAHFERIPKLSVEGY